MGSSNGSSEDLIKIKDEQNYFSVLETELVDSMSAMHIDPVALWATEYHITAKALPGFPMVFIKKWDYINAKIYAHNLIKQRFSIDDYWFDWVKGQRLTLARARKRKDNWVVGVVLIEEVEI
jgi:hypothetical protein